MNDAEPPHTQPPSAPPGDTEEDSERGTAVLGLLFLAALAGMWAVIYFLMLERGA